MTTRMVPGFLPSTSRFAFANAFPHVPVRRIGIPGIVSVPIGDARAAEAFLKTWDFEAYVEKYRSGAVVDVPGLVDGTS